MIWPGLNRPSFSSQSIHTWISPSLITPPLAATPVLFQYLIGEASSFRLRSAMIRSNLALTSSGGVACAQAVENHDVDLLAERAVAVDDVSPFGLIALRKVVLEKIEPDVLAGVALRRGVRERLACSGNSTTGTAAPAGEQKSQPGGSSGLASPFTDAIQLASASKQGTEKSKSVAVAGPSVEKRSVSLIFAISVRSG